jgi:hypothetical protein
MDRAQHKEKVSQAAQGAARTSFFRALLAGLSFGTLLLLKRPWVPADL